MCTNPYANGGYASVVSKKSVTKVVIIMVSVLALIGSGGHAGFSVQVSVRGSGYKDLLN
jgi:hypothetical protein